MRPINNPKSYILSLTVCRHEWDLSQPAGGATPLHIAAALDDEGQMVGTTCLCQ